MELHFVFDLEGTLVDLESLHLRAFSQVAQRLGVVFGDEQFRRFVGAGDRAISDAIVSEAAASNVSAQQVMQEKREIYLSLLQDQPIQPRDGAADYLNKANALCGGLVLASITRGEEAAYILEQSSLRPFFTHVLTEEHAEHRKPNPEVYLRAADLLSVSPQALLVHEDSPVGVTAGKTAGSYVAAFPVYEGLLYDPEPDVIFYSWMGLEPHVVMETVLQRDTGDHIKIKWVGQ